MNRFAVLIAALTLTATAAFAAEGNFERTLAVSGSPNLSVATGSGYVHVYSGSDSQIHIIGRIHVRSGMFGGGGDAEARVRQIVADPPIRQAGNTIAIGDNRSDSSLFHNVSIDYEITTPRSSTLKAESGSGDLEIGGIEGIVIADTGSGDMKVENIGANARLQTGSGSIHATNVHGAATLQTGSGDIDLRLTGAGDVKAQTGSGSIHISGLSGGLRAQAGSGEVEVTGSPTAEWRLESGSGSIHANVGSAAKFTLNAETGSGSIHIEQPVLMQGALNKEHVIGTVNGGGPTLRAATGSGSIEIR
ncbi:MAG: DUF4097 family beta strand repeat-containing protein [Acidobacteriaceae bacterium]|jgi:DUF4097 and DUF4098 domain-containing protein YvlB